MSAWGGRASTELAALTLSTYGTVCHLCHRPGATTPDHLIPRSHGGTDSLDNLRPAHASCNYARGNMPLADWFARHPLPRPGPRAAPSRRWYATATRLNRDQPALGP